MFLISGIPALGCHIPHGVNRSEKGNPTAGQFEPCGQAQVSCVIAIRYTIR
jgi:hypothetical protein